MFDIDTLVAADFTGHFTDARQLAQFLLAADNDDDVRRGDEQTGLIYVAAKGWLKTYFDYRRGDGLNNLDGAWEWFFDGLELVPEVAAYLKYKSADRNEAIRTICLTSIAQAAYALMMKGVNRD